MPQTVVGAKIALIREPLEMRRMAIKPEIAISSPEGLTSFTDEEHRILMDKVDTILKTGATVIICEGGLDDFVQITLGRRGILAIRRATKVDMNNLARAIGGRVVDDIDTISEDDLGYSDRISVRMMEGDNWLFIEGCRNPKAVTILLRGSSSNVVEGAGRAVRSALLSLDRATRNPEVFPGGGSLESELARQIGTWSLSLTGREQLAARKYAEALESTPRTLSETSGLNSLDALLALRSAHANGVKWFGVDVIGRRLADMKDSRVIDVKAVKLQVIRSASEVARTLIRIDGVFTKPKWNPPKRKEGPAAHRVTPPTRVPGFDYGEAKQFIPETW
jgi:archaeal chaperonin